MENQFSLLMQTRKNILFAIDKLSVAQLNKIPPGYRNTIAWNLGHLLVTQQLLCYKLSGLPMQYEDGFVNTLKKGTTPTTTYTEEEISRWKRVDLKCKKFGR